MGFAHIPHMSQTGIARAAIMAFACFHYVSGAASGFTTVATIVLMQRHRFTNPTIPGNQIRNLYVIVVMMILVIIKL